MYRFSDVDDVWDSTVTDGWAEARGQPRTEKSGLRGGLCLTFAIAGLVLAASYPLASAVLVALGLGTVVAVTHVARVGRQAGLMRLDAGRTVQDCATPPCG